MSEAHPPGHDVASTTPSRTGQSDALRTLFVYGTLMPGHLRWPMLASHAIGRRPASAAGTLHDSGQGWPVARLVTGARGGRHRDDPGDLVPGWAIDLDSRALDDLLEVLDEMEGVDRGLYDRVVVELDDGRSAWAYGAVGPIDGLPRIAAWTDQPES